MKKIVYTSPLFFNPESGHCRQFLIDPAGLKYHQKRDTAVLMLQSLGGINAPDTPEVRKYLKAIRSARRAIEKYGFYSTPVQSNT